MQSVQSIQSAEILNYSLSSKTVPKIGKRIRERRKGNRRLDLYGYDKDGKVHSVRLPAKHHVQCHRRKHYLAAVVLDGNDADYLWIRRSILKKHRVPESLISGKILRPRALYNEGKPYTSEPSRKGAIITDDGMTYDKDYLESYVDRPNHAIRDNVRECPLSKKPFKEPYYCAEDGQTYELEQIAARKANRKRRP